MYLLGFLPVLIIAALVVVVISSVASRRAREAGDEGLATAPRDLFLYLLRFVSLYLTAFGAVMLAFAGTDYFFPPDRGEEYLEPLRISISMLIVTFPLFVVITSVITRKINRDEMSRESLLRLTLAYFTLFTITISAMGTLIVVINGFLNGELTARFAIKAASVLVVIALVWWQYYLVDLKEARLTGFSKEKSVTRASGGELG